MLRIGGRRTFVHGLYQLPTGPNAWQRARDAGFQVVHRPATRAALDEAARNGMLAWCTTGFLSPEKRAADEKRIRDLVAALKDHPALAWWENEDEPSFTWKKPGVARVSAAAIRETYALVKQLDPAHPVYLNHAPTDLVSTLRQYDPGADLIATDIYPVIPHGIREQYALWADGQQGDFLDTSISQVGRYAGKMRQVAGPSRGLFMVLQAFAWEMLRKAGDRDPKMVLYPSAAQLRSMAWQAIAHGVTGLLWWGLEYTPPEAPLWNALAGVASELKRHAADLAAPISKPPLTIEYHETGHSIDRGLEWCARGKLLVIVNADKNPVEATITGLPAGARRERFDPFGVLLLRT